jgi:hypothetical protein
MLTHQVIVECTYHPPATPEHIARDVARVRQCLVTREIEHVTVYAAANGRRVIHVLAAHDAESARNGFRSAGVAFDGAWLTVART